MLIPKQPEAHQIRAQEHVSVISPAGEPLIVDWEPEARADMELQMREGVTVVAYSTDGLRLLKDCSVDGSYGFVQVSPKEQVIRLTSKDEVRANLPTSAAAVIRVGGEGGRERGIEIAMKIVGKFRTTRRHVGFHMLRGTCSGATHFVRGAMVGAFAMRSNAGGWAGSAAEVFGAEVGGSAEGGKAVENRDGDPKACDDKSQAALLEGCGALLRLELVPVGSQSPTSDPPESPAEAALQTTCPEGFVSVEGKCTRPGGGSPHACNPSDLSDCYEQCEEGSARSCVIAGLRERGLGDQLAPRGQVDPDQTSARRAAPADRGHKFFERACKANDSLGCTLLGDLYRFGSGVERDVLRAGSYYTRGCDDGVPVACTQLGTMYYYGDGLTQDLARAVELYGRGCDAGDERACSLLGDLHMTTSGEFHNPTAAVQLFRRACEGEDVAGCVSQVRAIEFGVGVNADVPDAIARKHRLCDRDPSLCGQLGINYLAGRGVVSHEAAARQLLLRACASLPDDKPAEAWGETDLYAFYACLISERRFGTKGASAAQKDAMAARVRTVLPLIASRCSAESVFECFDGGYLFALASDEAGASKLWEKGCSLGSGECCDAVKARPTTPPNATPPTAAAPSAAGLAPGP